MVTWRQLTFIVCLTLSERFEAPLAEANERWVMRELPEAARPAN